jgi:hypothetical protein
MNYECKYCGAALPLGNQKTCVRCRKIARREDQRMRLNTRCPHSNHVFPRKTVFVLQPGCAVEDGWTKSEWKQYGASLPEGSEVRFV